MRGPNSDDELKTGEDIRRFTVVLYRLEEKPIRVAYYSCPDVQERELRTSLLIGQTTEILRTGITKSEIKKDEQLRKIEYGVGKVQRPSVRQEAGAVITRLRATFLPGVKDETEDRAGPSS